LNYYDAGEHDKALRQFELAYAASENYRLLFNIGQIFYQQRQLARARATLERYLAEGGPDIPAARRSEVARQLAELTRKTGVLVLHLDEPGANVELGGQVLTATTRELRVVVDEGRNRVVARRNGLEPVERNIWIDGGATARLSIAFAPRPVPSPPSSPSPGSSWGTATWIAAGALGVLAVSAGTATWLSSEHYDELRHRRTETAPEAYRDRLDRQRERVETLVMVTDGLALSALAAAGVALYLSLNDSGESSSALMLEPGHVSARLQF
jgi:hypothetical protein